MDRQVLAQSDDAIDVVDTYRDAVSRTVLFPVRGEGGWTVEVVALVAVRPTAPDAGQPQ